MVLSLVKAYNLTTILSGPGNKAAERRRIRLLTSMKVRSIASESIAMVVEFSSRIDQRLSRLVLDYDFGRSPGDGQVMVGRGVDI